MLIASAFVLLSAGCNQSASTTGYSNPSADTSVAQVQPVKTNSENAMEVSESASASANSDVEINNDIDRIDSEMINFNADSVTADKSLSERTSAGVQ